MEKLGFREGEIWRGRVDLAVILFGVICGFWVDNFRFCIYGRLVLGYRLVEEIWEVFLESLLNFGNVWGWSLKVEVEGFESRIEFFKILWGKD